MRQSGRDSEAVAALFGALPLRLSEDQRLILDLDG
jgi:hypothetical protein